MSKRIDRGSAPPLLTLWMALALALALPLTACDDAPPPDGDGDGDADGDGDGDADGDGDGDADGDGDGDGDSDAGAVVEEPRSCEVVPLPERDYEATIRTTSYGVPHVTAADLGSLAFGHAYVMARENICYIADQIVSARSERARYFGPGDDDENVNHDFAYLALRLYEDSECAWGDLDEDVREVLTGYAAGYNSFLEERGVEDLPPQCAGADWVQPVSPIDLLAFYAHVALFGSAEPILGLIGVAEPPGGSNKRDPRAEPLPDLRDLGLGSNGWAIGSSLSENGRGMLLANPHFPWEGDLRFFESHLTIPGEVNVYGVSLIGIPAILIGFNEDIAWTHTVSSSAHFTIYTVDLEPGDPFHYRYDGEVRRMSQRQYAIQVRQSDGSLEEVTRTVYRTHYGPVLDFPMIGWTNAMTVTYRDANVNNFQILEHFIEVNRASGLDDFLAIQENVHGIPWVNTMYADREGNAFYTDSCTVPDLSDEAFAAWEEALAVDVFARLSWENGILMVNGSDSLFEWRDSPGAVQPGTIPFANAPQLLRDDFVLNANDSHWLSNPAEPLEGYSILYGPERTERSYRTRMNLVLASERGEGTTTGPDGLFSLDELERLAVGDMRGMMGELLRDAVVARCEGVSTVELDGEPVDITEACEVLAAWDLRYNVDSVGAVLWREVLSAMRSELGDGLWEVAFDPDDPVATPSGLAPAGDEGDRVLTSIARAVALIDAAGFSVSDPLGDVQYTLRGDERVPVPGGQWIDGTIAIAEFSQRSRHNYTLIPWYDYGDIDVNPDTNLTTSGYPVNYGNSWMMVVEFLEDGPRARAIVTYSASPDPSSPHYADQTEIYSSQTLRPVAFTEDDIAADLVDTVTIGTNI